MNYKIIKNISKLQDFIDKLPNLKENQKYYYSLFARKKYGATKGLKSDKCQLKRGTTTKERMIRDFKKLEVELGTYCIDDISINEDSLVLYITPNPRDLHKAGLKTIKKLVDLISNENKIFNPHSISLNQIQISNAGKFFDIDLDLKQNKVLNKSTLTSYIYSNINKEAIWNIIQTKGGYHIIIDLTKISNEYKSKWYNNFSKSSNEIFSITMNGDNMIPVPGCIQSDFIPNIL